MLYGLSLLDKDRISLMKETKGYFQNDVKCIKWRIELTPNWENQQSGALYNVPAFLCNLYLKIILIKCNGMLNFGVCLFALLCLGQHKVTQTV